MYKGIFYNNNKWRHGIFSYESVAEVIAFAGHNMKYTVKFTDDDFIPLMKLKENSEEPSSYMNPQGYVDPTSKYYIDRVWEEYHKLKEELADTKCKLAQAEDIIDTQRTLIKQIHKDEDTLIQFIERITPLVEAAKELNNSYHNIYAVNRVRKTYKHIEEPWEDVRARCS